MQYSFDRSRWNAAWKALFYETEKFKKNSRDVRKKIGKPGQQMALAVRFCNSFISGPLPPRMTSNDIGRSVAVFSRQRMINNANESNSGQLIVRTRDESGKHSLKFERNNQMSE